MMDMKIQLNDTNCISVQMNHLSESNQGETIDMTDHGQSVSGERDTLQCNENQ